MASLEASKALAALSPAHVAGYLRSRGWVDKGKYGSYGQLYVLLAEGREVQVVLPRLSTIADFPRRMSEVIDALAQVEHREPPRILFDLTLTPFDVIRVRAKDADAYGSVRFGEGLLLHEEARNLIVAAALAATSDHPRRAWKGRYPNTIADYLERVRLGQTENASFSLTILSPYSFDVDAQSTLFGEDAFGRRVARHFGTALAAIEGALAEAVSDPLSAFEQKIAQGVSAELCQALGKLADNDSGIEVSIHWSPAKPLDELVRLSLTRQDAAVLSEVARKFAREEPEFEFTIEGLVEEIKEKPEQFNGSVVIQTPFPNQRGVRKIRVRFEEQYRNTVYEAAKNKRWVRVTGTLIHEGKMLKLSDPHDFAIVDPSDEVEAL